MTDIVLIDRGFAVVGWSPQDLDFQRGIIASVDSSVDGLYQFTLSEALDESEASITIGVIFGGGFACIVDYVSPTQIDVKFSQITGGYANAAFSIRLRKVNRG